MRYTPKQYATALFELLRGASPAARPAAAKAMAGEDAIIRRFAEILVKNHDRALLPKILRHFKMLERTVDKKHFVELVAVSPPAPAIIKEIKTKLGERAEVQTKVDLEMLGGIKIIIDEETVIDGTWKARINQLVRRMINSQ